MEIMTQFYNNNIIHVTKNPIFSLLNKKLNGLFKKLLKKMFGHYEFHLEQWRWVTQDRSLEWNKQQLSIRTIQSWPLLAVSPSEIRDCGILLKFQAPISRNGGFKIYRITDCIIVHSSELTLTNHQDSVGLEQHGIFENVFMSENHFQKTSELLSGFDPSLGDFSRALERYQHEGFYAFYLSENNWGKFPCVLDKKDIPSTIVNCRMLKYLRFNRLPVVIDLDMDSESWSDERYH